MSQALKDAESLLLSTATLGKLKRDETPEEKRAREDAEFLESIRLDSSIPPLTEGDVIRSVQSGKGLWRSFTVLRAEVLEAERQRKEREALDALTIQPIPDPEF